MLFTCIKSWFFRTTLPISTKFHIDPSVEVWLIVYSNDHAPLTVRPINSSSKLRTAQMMIFSLVAMIGLEKCCITSACLQWLCHSGERPVARGPLVQILGQVYVVRSLGVPIFSVNTVYIFMEKSITIFYLITIHTPLSTQSSSSIVFRL